jgi:hypothetical protein
MIIEKWLESLSGQMNDEELNSAIEAHLTEYDDMGYIKTKPSADEISQMRVQYYAALRRGAYGTWQEQLDKQFSGTWEEHVSQVKSRFAK